METHSSQSAGGNAFQLATGALYAEKDCGRQVIALLFFIQTTIYRRMPCRGRFPIICKNLVVILLSGATGRKQPTFQRRQTVRWSQFEATGDQLSASGEIISLSLCSVQVPKIIFVSLSQDYLCVFVSLSEDHFCLFHRSKF